VIIIALRFTVQRLQYIRPNRCVWKLPTNWNRLWRLFKVNGNGTAGLFDNSHTIRVQFRVPRHCSPLANFFSRPFLAVSRDRSFRMIMTWFDPIFNLLRWEDDQITSLHCALSHSYTYTDNIKKNSCLLKYGFSNLIPTREKLVWNQIMWLLRLLICCLRFLEQCSPEWVPYFTWAVVRHECRHLQRGCKL